MTRTAGTEVLARLLAELERPVPEALPKPPCPYPGMVPFREADSDRFFGRDDEVQEALERLRLHPFLAVIGPSGSGKSSYVYAGLVPTLRKSGLFGPGGWLVRSCDPAKRHWTALRDALGGDPSDPERAVADLLFAAKQRSAHPEARRLLLVVDQYEEAFAVPPEDREPFERALLRSVPGPRMLPSCSPRGPIFTAT